MPLCRCAPEPYTPRTYAAHAHHQHTCGRSRCIISDPSYKHGALEYTFGHSGLHIFLNREKDRRREGLSRSRVRLLAALGASAAAGGFGGFFIASWPFWRGILVATSHGFERILPRVLLQARDYQHGAFGGIATLRRLVAVVTEPRTALADDAVVNAEVNDFAALRDILSPNIMSKSARLKGGATLFFTTLTAARRPSTSSPSLMVERERMSRRTEA